MKGFEKLMNITGRKILRVLFIVALFFCSPCAEYFFLKQKNFQCPICQYIKRFQTTDKSNSLISSLSNHIEKHYEKNEFSIKRCAIKKSIELTIAADNLNSIVCSYSKLKPNEYLAASLHYLGIRNRSRFYILFHQLKIGEIA